MNCHSSPYILRFAAAFTKPKKLVSDIPDDAMTIYLGVQGTGVANFKVSGSRYGLAWVRYFQLAAGQDVAVDVSDASSVVIWVTSGTIVGQVVGVASPDQRAPKATSEAYYYASYAGGAAAVATHSVPPGALSMSIASAVSAIDWVLVDSANTAQTMVGSTAVGSVVPVRGSSFTVPAGETLEVFWLIKC